ncbi:transglycosylase SLT domain-containing protein [Rodentibacter pneumotropicus]|uniref:Lytic murein transglycosylase n=1 Tax=Rodentibacter pneumotropicus TaxID=758 RepID=A0A4S2PDW4_9PAST|nr:transglycosylase SLT domain-containing protein [Rodentibacter pneumotropicus]THA01481.1 lytic murein transglycosylase [Rodentibacter pneumotropicus]THA02882.1 lytic murein transglycosylase [Rodentibacter pneumotropicus]THA08414.1 lytic murein transglycosylase [Rodentibacter pneumotropicus]THA15789.1 lytic murein transglycosylase [Rodentibacter pneumotropicus]
MKKLPLISLAILTALSQPIRANTNADKSKSTLTINLAEEQLKWQQNQENTELKRLNQRATFLQFENLLKSAVKNKRVFENRAFFLSLIHSLEGYPLQTDAWFAYFDSQIKSVTQNTPSTEVMTLKKEIEDYIAQYPHHFLRSRLEQNILTLLNNSDSEQFVDYAKKITPNGVEMQIAVLGKEYQLIQKSSESNKNHQQAQEADILNRFETLWLNNGELTNDSDLWKKWYANGGRTADKIYQKAENLFAKNDGKGLALLAGELDNLDNIKEDPIILADLQDYTDLLKNPVNLKKFAEALPDSEKGKIRRQFAIIQGFSRYLRTLPENMDNPDFTPYLQWAKNWRLSDTQIRHWKIAFISRFFDNETPHFQQWRDAEILALKADNLVERRLRMAIWQKTDLIPWLNALSKEGKEKQEWRYWLAKSDQQKTQEILTALSKERGFYPMLAKAMLNPQNRGADYHIELPQSTLNKKTKLALIESQRTTLNEIAELRQLDRLGAAKQRWRFLLESLSGDSKQAKQIALSEYANQQGWFDLGVDGSIIAKAWNHIALRLPNAYQNYFDIALMPLPAKIDNSVTKTFAMAIARQESAWNPMAQSSANARGLMQLLPNTAKATADNNQLPYQAENDLFKPFNNILLGTAHLNELNIKYPNNRILIAAAYNAGANRVEKWLARAGGKLAMDEFIASIPFFETRGYVQNVLAYDFYYQLLQHQENPQTFSQEEFDRLY